MLALAFVGTNENDKLRDPASVLAPFIRTDVPAFAYLTAAVSYRLKLGESRMILGLSIRNPFGANYRDLLAARAPDGSNYGAEPQGPHALLSARLVY